MLTLAHFPSLLASYGGAGSTLRLRSRETCCSPLLSLLPLFPSAIRYFRHCSFGSFTATLLRDDPFSSSNMSDPIAGAAQKHPAPEGLVYTYGTAGVRGRL
jgi:hypothetical protein